MLDSELADLRDTFRSATPCRWKLGGVLALAVCLACLPAVVAEVEVATGATTPMVLGFGVGLFGIVFAAFKVLAFVYGISKLGAP